MIPVNTTINGNNCFTACIASLLEMSIEEMPNYSDDSQWFLNIQKWLYEKGFQLVWIPAQCLEIMNLIEDYYYIVCYYTTGGTLHAVIHKGDQVVHNPSPSTEHELDLTADIYFIGGHGVQNGTISK